MFFFPYKYSQKKLKQNQKADMTRTSTPKYNKEMYSAMGIFSDITKSELQYSQKPNCNTPKNRIAILPKTECPKDFINRLSLIHEATSLVSH